MRRRAIVTLVTLVHLAALVFILRTCTFGPGGDGSGPGRSEADPTDTGGQREGTGGAGGTRTVPGHDLRRIPFSYVSRRLPDDIAAREKACRTGILVDWDSYEILWRKFPDRPVPIASMTKMMTTLLTVEELDRNPSLALSTPVQVTPQASEVGGSQVYLDPRESLTIDELLKCVMIFSANDAAYLLAQYLGDGEVGAFVNRMNTRADALGLEHAKFVTPHGLTDSTTGATDQATATELAFLAAILLEHPEVVRWSSTRLAYIREDSERFDPFQLVNRNALVTNCDGVNGMKTGYTRKAGFCVAATCKREGRTLIAVVTGCSSKNDRNELVKALFDWGYGL